MALCRQCRVGTALQPHYNVYAVRGQHCFYEWCGHGPSVKCCAGTALVPVQTVFERSGRGYNTSLSQQKVRNSRPYSTQVVPGGRAPNHTRSSLHGRIHIYMYINMYLVEGTVEAPPSHDQLGIPLRHCRSLVLTTTAARNRLPRLCCLSSSLWLYAGFLSQLHR